MYRLIVIIYVGLLMGCAGTTGPSAVFHLHGNWTVVQSAPISSSPAQGNDTAAATTPVPTVTTSTPKTIYPSKWDDPTEVVFRNRSSHPVCFTIDGGKEKICLKPGESTGDRSVDVGQHEVKAVFEIPTKSFGVKTVERTIRFTVSLNSPGQVVPIYGY